MLPCPGCSRFTGLHFPLANITLDSTQSHGFGSSKREPRERSRRAAEPAAGSLPEELPELRRFSGAEGLSPRLVLKRGWVISMTVIIAAKLANIMSRGTNHPALGNTSIACKVLEDFWGTIEEFVMQVTVSKGPPSTGGQISA